MRKFTLVLALLAGAVAMRAQTVATFDTLSLPKADTFYVNYSNPGQDVGFNDGLAHFPCIYDTAWGGLWSSGFAYSNMKDSTTSGYGNMYAAKAFTGFDSSNAYAVVWGSENNLILTGAAKGKPVKGFYATNSTYAYNTMRDGDQFSKKFTGHDSDFFRLTIKGYNNGQLTTDSVDFYLADFRHADTTQNYLVKDWRWVDLESLGNVDSLHFSLYSSDGGTGYSMMTPAYFCMDNFTTFENVGVKNIPAQFAAKVYPNPATNVLYVEAADKAIKTARVFDVTGKFVGAYTITNDRLAIDIAALPSGIYTLHLAGAEQTATVRFVKQ